MIVIKYLLLILIINYIILINYFYENYNNGDWTNGIMTGESLRYYLLNYYDCNSRKLSTGNTNTNILLDKYKNLVNKITLLSVYNIGTEYYIIFTPSDWDLITPLDSNISITDTNYVINTIIEATTLDDFDKYLYIAQFKENAITLYKNKRASNTNTIDVLDNIYNNTYTVTHDGVKILKILEREETETPILTDNSNELLYKIFTEYQFSKIQDFFKDIRCRINKNENDGLVGDSCDDTTPNPVTVTISFVFNFSLSKLLN